MLRGAWRWISSPVCLEHWLFTIATYPQTRGGVGEADPHQRPPSQHPDLPPDPRRPRAHHFILRMSCSAASSPSPSSTTSSLLSTRHPSSASRSCPRVGSTPSTNFGSSFVTELHPGWIVIFGNRKNEGTYDWKPQKGFLMPHRVGMTSFGAFGGNIFLKARADGGYTQDNKVIVIG